MKFKDLKVGGKYRVVNPLWRRCEFKVVCKSKNIDTYKLEVIGGVVRKFEPGTRFLKNGQMIRDLKPINNKPWSVDRHAAQAMIRIDKQIEESVRKAKLSLGSHAAKFELSLAQINRSQVDGVNWTRMFTGIAEPMKVTPVIESLINASIAMYEFCDTIEQVFSNSKGETFTRNFVGIGMPPLSKT